MTRMAGFALTVGMIFLAGCYTVLRHEQVVIPSAEEDAYDTEHAAVSPASECWSCHEGDMSAFGDAYHSSDVPAQYVIWMEYFENPAPWWVTVPSHDPADGSSNGEDDLTARTNYGRRTNLNTGSTSLPGSTAVGTTGGGSTLTGSPAGETATGETSGSARTERSRNEGTQRKSQSDNSQRDTSGRKTNKK